MACRRCRIRAMTRRRVDVVLVCAPDRRAGDRARVLSASAQGSRWQAAFVRGVGPGPSVAADEQERIHPARARGPRCGDRRAPWADVIRPLDEHAQDVFLVSGPSPFRLEVRPDPGRRSPALEQLVDEVQADPDVVTFRSRMPSSSRRKWPSGLNLNGSAVAILDALTDRTLVDYFGGQVWNGYVNQPAAAAIRLSASHAAGATGAGHRRDHRHGRRSEPPAARGIAGPGLRLRP